MAEAEVGQIVDHALAMTQGADGQVKGAFTEIQLKKQPEQAKKEEVAQPSVVLPAYDSTEEEMQNKIAENMVKNLEENYDFKIKKMDKNDAVELQLNEA